MSGHCDYCGNHVGGNNIIEYTHVSDIQHEIYLCYSCSNSPAEQVYANFQKTSEYIADWE